MPLVTDDQRRKVARGELDVGRLFVDTKTLYLDAKARAAELNQPRLHVDVMFAIVEMLGRLLREIQALRTQITRGEVGLDGFDADFVGVALRHRNLYRRFFKDLPSPEAWEGHHWQSFEEQLEGPILMWDLKTCQERWGLPFGSQPCEGPDLLMALSLLHQTGVAQKHQQALIKSVYGFADLTLQDLSNSLDETARSFGRTIAQGLGAIAEGAASYFVSPPGPRRSPWSLATLATLGIGGYLLLTRTKNTKTTNPST